MWEITWDLTPKFHVKFWYDKKISFWELGVAYYRLRHPPDVQKSMFWSVLVIFYIFRNFKYDLTWDLMFEIAHVRFHVWDLMFEIAHVKSRVREISGEIFQ